MKKLRYLIPIIIEILGATSIYAETSDIRNSLDFMFSKIIPKEVPTGLLRDYAIEEEDLDLYSGKNTLDNNNKVSIIKYSGILNTIKSADISNVKPLHLFENNIKQQPKTSDIRISIALFNYAQIKATALSSGIISFENGQVRVIQDSISPYQIGTVLAGCCLDYITESSNVTFKIPKELIIGNINLNEIDINFGNGFISCNPDQQVNASLEYGENNIIIRTKVNGVYLYTHTFIYVTKPNQPESRSSIAIYPSDDEFTKSGNYRGVETTATVTIKYGKGNTSLKKPFIFIEGFDPSCISSSNRINRSGVNYYDQFMRDYETWVNTILSLGYDFIYVDWKNSDSYLQANGNTLIEVIKEINKRKAQTGSSEKNSIIGHSMGGLLCRYALKSMEMSNIKHETENYISYDAPHLGAHIPLGVLYGFNGILKFIDEHNLLKSIADMVGNDIITNLTNLGKSMAYSPAAKQMLVHYVDPLGNFNNSEHIAWQQEINNLGFPKGDPGQTFNMNAIAHSNYNNNSIFLPEGTYLSTSFKAESDITHLIPWLSSVTIGLCMNDVVAALLNVLPGRSSIEGIFDIYPAKDKNQKVTHINMKYKKKFLWVVSISKNLFSYDRYFSGNYLYDTYPSSSFDLSINAKPDKLGWPIIGQFEYDVNPYNHIPFIPTSSAIAYGNGIDSPASYFTSEPSSNSTIFGKNYYLMDGRSHTSLSMDALSWALSRISNTIVGPNIGTDGVKYSVSGISSGITWSTSNPQIATISSSGILSVKGKGIITIIAQSKNTSYSKEILVGLPRFVLEASHTPGGYKVNANCIDSQYSNKLSNLNEAISYMWAVKFPNKDLKWMESNYPEILIQPEKDSQEVTVFLKVIDKLGNSSTTQSIKVCSQDIFEASNQNLYITSDGKMYDEWKDSYPYEGGRIYIDYKGNIPSEYYKLEWMPTSANIATGYCIRNIPISDSGPEISDIISLDELNSIISTAIDGQNYTYILELLNMDGKPIQFLPIVFTYKKEL